MDSANAASAASQKKRSSLLPRLISALVLIPLIVGLVWWNYWSVVAIVVGVTVVALRELYGVLARGGYRPMTLLGIAIGVGLVAAVALRPLVAALDTVGLMLTVGVIASLIAALPHQERGDALLSWGLTLAGALYFSWLVSHFIMLRGLDTPLAAGPLRVLAIPPGAAWIFLVLAITWLQDAAAYFVGRAWGRHKLAPTLSPKKTWEGAIGGLVASVLGGALATWLFGLPLSPLVGALFGLLGGVIGPLGDLAESMIKRQVGLKDAGSLIPGHGGLLDRADSLLFVAPLIFYLIPLFVAS